jgi:hypothetical protein
MNSPHILRLKDNVGSTLFENSPKDGQSIYLLACDHFGCLMSHALGDFGASSSELQRQKPGKSCRAAKVDSVHCIPTQARA